MASKRVPREYLLQIVSVATQVAVKRRVSRYYLPSSSSGIATKREKEPGAGEEGGVAEPVYHA